MLLGYLMNDLLREYVASGEFTRRGKWCSAFREAAMFYVPALLVGIIIVVYMMIQTGARLARLDAAAPCTQAATLCIRAATLGIQAATLLSTQRTFCASRPLLPCALCATLSLLLTPEITSEKDGNLHPARPAALHTPRTPAHPAPPRPQVS